MALRPLVDKTKGVKAQPQSEQEDKPRSSKSKKSGQDKPQPSTELRLHLAHPTEKERQRDCFITDYGALKSVWTALPEADAAILQPSKSDDVILAYDHVRCSTNPSFGVIDFVLQKNVAVNVTAAEAKGTTTHPIAYQSACELQQALRRSHRGEPSSPNLVCSGKSICRLEIPASVQEGQDNCEGC